MTSIDIINKMVMVGTDKNIDSLLQIKKEIQKEIATQKKKQYREDNKEMIREYQKLHQRRWRSTLDYKKKVTCPVCGSVTAFSAITAHRRTNKHQTALLKQFDEEEEV